MIKPTVAIVNAPRVGPAGLNVERNAPLESFNEMLRGAARSSSADEIRKAAIELVSTALVKPALASLRENPWARGEGGPFAPGPAERRFGPLLDQRFADNVTQASNFSLVDRLVTKFSAGNRT